MNSNPHTHELVIRESPYSHGVLLISYGDQKEKRVNTNFPGWNHRLRRKVRRIVARHDRQSVRAGTRSERLVSLQSQYALRDGAPVWGSGVLAGRVTLPPRPKAVIAPYGSVGHCRLLAMGGEGKPVVVSQHTDRYFALREAAARGYEVVDSFS